MDNGHYLGLMADLQEHEIKDFCIFYLKAFADWYDLDIAYDALCMVADEMGDL